LHLKITTNPKTIHWIFMVIFCLGLFICIYWLYSSWLKSAWEQNFPVQQIKRVIEERDEAETQLFIAFENGKEVSLNFRTNETYLSDFLKELKQKTNFEHIKQ